MDISHLQAPTDISGPGSAGQGHPWGRKAAGLRFALRRRGGSPGSLISAPPLHLRVGAGSCTWLRCGASLLSQRSGKQRASGPACSCPSGRRSSSPEPSSSLPLSCPELAKQRAEEGMSGTGLAEMELGWCRTTREAVLPLPRAQAELGPSPSRRPWGSLALVSPRLLCDAGPTPVRPLLQLREGGMRPAGPAFRLVRGRRCPAHVLSLLPCIPCPWRTLQISHKPHSEIDD